MDPSVLKAITACPRGNALDLGCGRGRHALFLAREGFTVDAVDKDETAIAMLIRAARSEPFADRIATHGVDVRTFPLTKRYALVNVFNVLHFMSQDDREALVERLRDATARSGLHIVSAPTYEGTLPPGRYPFLTRLELEGYYAGWDIVSYAEAVHDTQAQDPAGKPYRHTFAVIVARKP